MKLQVKYLENTEKPKFSSARPQIHSLYYNEVIDYRHLVHQQAKEKPLEKLPLLLRGDNNF